MVMVAEQVTDARLLVKELNGSSDWGVLHEDHSCLLPHLSPSFLLEAMRTLQRRKRLSAVEQSFRQLLRKASFSRQTYPALYILSQKGKRL